MSGLVLRTTKFWYRSCLEKRFSFRAGTANYFNAPAIIKSDLSLCDLCVLSWPMKFLPVFIREIDPQFLPQLFATKDHKERKRIRGVCFARTRTRKSRSSEYEYCPLVGVRVRVRKRGNAAQKLCVNMRLSLSACHLTKTKNRSSSIIVRVDTLARPKQLSQ